MEKTETKVRYDADVDILSISQGKKVKESVEISGFVIDLDMSGHVAGIEILDASSTLNLSSQELDTIHKVTLHVEYAPAAIRIHLSMKIGLKEIIIPLVMSNAESMLSVR